jgi:serine O-acetyltransferase
VVKEVPPGATVVGVPGRLVEDADAKQAERFAAYAVVAEQDDPYAKAIKTLAEHSRELEERLARLEKPEVDKNIRIVK